MAGMTWSPRYRLAGWAAVVSGVIGLVAFGLLIDALVMRVKLAPAADTEAQVFLPGPWDLPFRSHLVGVALQALLLIPAVLWLHRLGRQRSPRASRATAVVGVLGQTGIVLAVLLVFATRAFWNDGLYFFPQGLVGVWLVAAGVVVSGLLPRGLTRGAIVAGLFLVVTGAANVGIAIAEWPVLLAFDKPGVAADPAAASSTLNQVSHNFLLLGIFGRVIYPIWAILLGRRMLREGGA